MLLLIDNYDSFTYNLYHFLAANGATETKVVRNDQITVDEVKKLAPKGIIISPGPCTPNEAGMCLDIVKTLGTEIPMMGVCLGHQVIAQSFGGTIIRAEKVMHGKTSPITHNGSKLYKDIPSPFTVTRYHSLIIERETLPDCFDITSETSDNIIMGIEHKEHPLFGVQFHPESIASEQGHELLKNFTDML